MVVFRIGGGAAAEVGEDTEDGAEVADGAAFLVVGTSSMYGAQTGASSAVRMRSRQFRRSVDPFFGLHDV